MQSKLSLPETWAQPRPQTLSTSSDPAGHGYAIAVVGGLAPPPAEEEERQQVAAQQQVIFVLESAQLEVAQVGKVSGTC